MEISTIQLDNTVFLVFKGTEYQQVSINSIVAIQVIEKYLEITTTSAKYFVLASLNSVSKHLINFVKVNNGLIINRYYILKLIHLEKDKSKYKLVMRGPKDEFWTIEISDYLAKKVIEQL